eukprot:scaffold649494_cov37-Prasinocladus_malaysianus.AAC.1
MDHAASTSCAGSIIESATPCGDGADILHGQLDSCFQLPDEVLKIVIDRLGREAWPVLRWVSRDFSRLVTEAEHNANITRHYRAPLRLRHVSRTPDLLAWALDQSGGDLPYKGPRVCALATFFGGLDALRVARDRGCRWDSATCAAAALRGDLELL